MNSISIMPAPVAAQISGPGSFFGSCQIASGNFEDILSSMSESNMPELPTANSNSENLAEEPTPLAFAFQDFNKSEVLIQLQQILGEDVGAEAYERIINLLEKGTLSVQADTINWDKDTFEKLTVSLLERLDLAIKQITKAFGDGQKEDVQEYEKEDSFAMDKVLNLIADLLKTGMISPQEYETALKNPEESSLPELLGELKKETVKLIEELEIAETEQPKQVEQFIKAENPKQVEQPKQNEGRPRQQAEWQRQVEEPRQAEQPRRVEQPERVEQPIYTEQPIRAEWPKQAEEPEQVIEQPKQAERPIHYTEQQSQQPQPIQAEWPQAEDSSQVEQSKQAKQPTHYTEQQSQPQPMRAEWPKPAENPRQAEQPKQVEQPVYMEQPKQAQTEQIESLLEELRVVSMEMEEGIKPKDQVKFYELINNSLEKGLLNEQDLKNAMKMPAIENESNSLEPNSKSEKKEAEKIEPVSLRNILDKLWTKIESENKVEKENVFLRFREIVESKNPNGEKIEIKQAKAEVEVRAVWEAGDLKIETVNPKTGEKLQSVPVANSNRMQERIHEFEVVRQVVAQAKFITTPTGEQKLTMQLRPENLGQMNLRIVLNNGEMQIHARVESITAQAALESHIGLLREGLEKQGINLDRLEVSVEQRDRQDAFSLAEKHEQQEKHGKGKHHHRNKEMHLAVSVKNDENSDTGRRLGYNTMEYLA